uniref:Uncharacterized protein n=1 Tax=Anguilla anguilla TaxID=7936 RepID=A0A0E9UX06_ANGAN
MDPSHREPGWAAGRDRRHPRGPDPGKMTSRDPSKGSGSAG